jgi:protein-L-isoaspartate(D-aspartate) O-methyltransferase
MTSANTANIEKARFNMVEQQVRPWNISDSKVLDLLATVPREHFVPAAYQSVAFADTVISLGDQQEQMPPVREEARMLQALDIQSTDIVLEVGTGSGYVTALLANLAKQVYSVEINENLSTDAGEKLKVLGLQNVSLDVGDASENWSKHGPYDIIVLSGAVHKLPDSYLDNLSTGGRLFVVEGEGPAQQAVIYTKTNSNDWQKTTLFETKRPALINSIKAPSFKL